MSMGVAESVAIARRLPGAFIPFGGASAHVDDADGIAMTSAALVRHRGRGAPDASLHTSEERFRALLSEIDIGAVTLNASGKVLFINDHLQTLLGRSRDEIVGHDWIGNFMPAHERTEFRKILRTAIAANEAPANREIGIVTRSGEERRLSWTGLLLRDDRGRVVALAGIAQDLTGYHALRSERALLATAVSETADCVVTTDPSFNIMSVNPAFERVTGYARDEVLGKYRPFLEADPDDPTTPAAYEEMRSTMRAGKAWQGEMVKRRKDGTQCIQSVTVTPIFDTASALSSFIFVERDLSLVRELEAELVLEAAVRALLGEAIQAAATSSDLEQAAQAVCNGLVSLPGIHLAQLVSFHGEGEAVLVAGHSPNPSSLSLGDRLPTGSARYLQERAKSGAWGERPGSKGGYWHKVVDMGARGAHALALGPVGPPGNVAGVLIVGTHDRRYAGVVAEKMPPLVAFGASANTLLVQRLMTRRRDHSLRSVVEDALSARAYQIVFQPIVELSSGETIGYEALSRFPSGQPADRFLADAWSIGLGVELELATLEAAVGEASRLPAGRWLDLNVSPRLLDTPGKLASILSDAGRPIVIEITEHDRIDDYGRTRAAVAALGDDVRLAVDDAGVGIANFGHIIGLRPDFVKLDLSLVRRVNADPGRQALVVAMRHFARTAGCRLVAEGVETDEEARALKQLGVEFAQGFWFGRPESADRW